MIESSEYQFEKDLPVVSTDSQEVQMSGKIIKSRNAIEKRLSEIRRFFSALKNQRKQELEGINFNINSLNKILEIEVSCLSSAVVHQAEEIKSKMKKLEYEKENEVVVATNEMTRKIDILKNEKHELEEEKRALEKRLKEAFCLVEDCSIRKNDRIKSLESEKQELEIKVSKLVTLSKSQKEEILNLEKEKEKEKEFSRSSKEELVLFWSYKIEATSKIERLENEKKKLEEETRSLAEAKSVLEKCSIEKDEELKRVNTRRRELEIEVSKSIPPVTLDEEMKKAISVEVSHLRDIQEMKVKKMTEEMTQKMKLLKSRVMNFEKEKQEIWKCHNNDMRIANDEIKKLESEKKELLQANARNSKRKMKAFKSDDDEKNKREIQRLIIDEKKTENSDNLEMVTEGAKSTTEYNENKKKQEVQKYALRIRKLEGLLEKRKERERVLESKILRYRDRGRKWEKTRHAALREMKKVRKTVSTSNLLKDYDPSKRRK